MGREQTEETRIKLSIANGGTGKVKSKNSGYCLFCNKPISKINKYCSIYCQQDYQYNQKVKQWLNGEISGTIKGGHASFIRRYLFEKYNNKCSKCGWKEINLYSKFKFPVLKVEHIDGRTYNNKPNNVTLLCPNCKTLTSTYKQNNNDRYMEKYYMKAGDGKLIVQ